MYGKALSLRDAQGILVNNGYRLDRINGGHLIYKNDSNGKTMAITNGNKTLSQKTWNRECKKCGIVLDKI